MSEDLKQLQSLSEADFDTKVINNPRPVVVVFSTSWSGYAYFLQTSLSNIASDFEEKVNFYMIDMDEAPALAQGFGVSTSPSMLFFKQGEIVEYVTGPLPEREIKERIENKLLS